MSSGPITIPGQLSFDDPAMAGVGPGDTPEAVEAQLVITGADPDDEARIELPPLTVEVIRSSKRRKTAQARLIGLRLEIRIPARCSRAEEAELVEHFTAKFERTRQAEAVDLTRRAADLARRHGLPSPESIRWVSNQQHRWGSCTPSDRTIRLSDRLVSYPTWVIDYVIVHELAHLVVRDHSKQFWRLVNDYPLTERARGFLIAKGLEGD